MKRFAQVNVIPFIDIMLVLLAIVLTTATFISQGRIALELPRAEHTEAMSSEESVEIAVDKDGGFFLDQAPIAKDALAEKLAALDKETPVVLYVDRSARFASFVTIVDLLKANQLEKLSIVARGER
jgi:biopolymer transport protein ExbD